QEIHLSSGLKVVLEAGSELTFKAAGSFVKLDAGGITLSGPSVRLNSGGSPGKGSGAKPALPEAPNPADTAPTGERTNRGQGSPLPPPASVAEQCPRKLIIDIWGDPAVGGQVQLLDPEGDV
ncbi:DUF2345 domain-containing protein, partial [Pseudomonas stutzeri]|nr:DUF2345 domain-containing protein [Stutzerimonas stutzeri]